MVPLAVVVFDIFIDHVTQVSLTDDDHPIQTLGFDREHEPFGIRVEVGTAGWKSKRSNATHAQHAPELSCVERIPVVDQESLVPQEAIEIINLLPSHLLHPQAVRDWCDAHDLDMACGQVNHEEHQIARKAHSRPDLDGEEVGCSNRIKMRLNECLPGCALGSLRRWADAMLSQDASNRGSCNTVAQVGESTLDS